MLTLTSGFGHDKSLTIRPYSELPAEQRPTLFYAGDGVSDLSAAKETDLLFAKKGRGTFNNSSACGSGLICCRSGQLLCKTRCPVHRL